jgi:predicted RNA-binding Zn ribbon-like protein
MTTIPEPVGNALCLDFVNTVNRRPDPQRDLLEDPGDLSAWAAAVGIPIEATTDQVMAQLSPLRMLREHVYGVFSALEEGESPPEPALAAVTREYARGLPHARWERSGTAMTRRWPRPVRPEHLGWHVAGSALDLLATGPLDRLGRCPGCGWLYLDTSRNGQRRWCSMATCGSRAKSARYFAASRRH